MKNYFRVKEKKIMNYKKIVTNPHSLPTSNIQEIKDKEVK